MRNKIDIRGVKTSKKNLHWMETKKIVLAFLCEEKGRQTYPLISQRSFSKPLCIDWAIELSIRSTYRTTWGAKVSRKCWWNFPFLRLSKKRRAYFCMSDEINILCWNGYPNGYPTVILTVKSRIGWRKQILY